MPPSTLIPCDGCGQPASPEHLARRLQRLEWATRYRPIHLHTLLMGAIAPESQANFLYSPDEEHTGEAAQVLAAIGIKGTDKKTEAIHTEVQRRGLFLTHILECPLEAGQLGTSGSANALPDAAALIGPRLSPLFTRIRRSLKPKRLVFISGILTPEIIEKFVAADLGSEFVLDRGRAFALDATDSTAVAESTRRLHEVLAVPASR